MSSKVKFSSLPKYRAVLHDSVGGFHVPHGGLRKRKRWRHGQSGGGSAMGSAGHGAGGTCTGSAVVIVTAIATGKSSLQRQITIETIENSRGRGGGNKAFMGLIAASVELLCAYSRVCVFRGRHCTVSAAASRRHVDASLEKKNLWICLQEKAHVRSG